MILSTIKTTTMTRMAIDCENGDEARMVRMRAQKAMVEGEDVFLRYSERVNGKIKMTVDYGAGLTENEVMSMLLQGDSNE